MVVANVYNSFGQKVICQSGQTNEGMNDVALNTSNLAEGIYILEILFNGERRIEKFSVIK
jgi:hypothetical protein